MANDLQLQAALIVATFELKAVRSIRDAVRVNTLKKGGREGPLGNIDNPKPPPSLPNYGEQRHGAFDPDAHASQPRVEHHRAIEPSRRSECYGAAHATHAPQRLPDFTPTDLTLPTSDAERASGLPSQHGSPLAPPWAMPLPIPESARVRLVKYVVPTADLSRKGSLVDCFV